MTAGILGSAPIPNSMIPFVLLAPGGSLALTRVASLQAEHDPVCRPEVVRVN